MPETALEQRCGECRFFRGFGALAPDGSKEGQCLNQEIAVGFTRSNNTAEAALTRMYFGYKIAGMKETNTSCFSPKIPA